MNVYWNQILVTDPTHPNFDVSSLYYPSDYDGSLDLVVEYLDDSSDYRGSQVEGHIISAVEPVTPVQICPIEKQPYEYISEDWDETTKQYYVRNSNIKSFTRTNS